MFDNLFTSRHFSFIKFITDIAMLLRQSQAGFDIKISIKLNSFGEFRRFDLTRLNEQLSLFKPCFYWSFYQNSGNLLVMEVCESEYELVCSCSFDQTLPSRWW